MFKINISGKEQPIIELIWDKAFCERIVIEKCLPIAILSVFVSTIWSGRCIFHMNKTFRISKAFHLVICIVSIGVSSVPFLQLSPGLQERTLMTPSQFFVKPWSKLQPYYFSNGYGLFRRMTGVGNTQPRRQLGHDWGYAGLPPSVVERPEIILKVELLSPSETVRELNFRWKPGDISKMPRQVAPYQPRLDWQMWFAALGSYHHNPWLVHFIHKILQGCKPVIALIDEPGLVSGAEEVLQIHALLFNYDFTRLDTEWSRKIPGRHLITSESESSDPGPEPENVDNHRGIWWTRSFDKDYLPPLDSSNESLRRLLESQGFHENMCLLSDEKCKLLSDRTSLHTLCRFTTQLRLPFQSY